MRSTRSARVFPFLQPRLQGPRSPELARRRLSHTGAAGRSRKGGQQRDRRLGEPFAAEAQSSGPRAQVAQLVEHVTENHGVGGSIPPLGTIPRNREIISTAYFLTGIEVGSFFA